jgi:hypothetical protein
MMRCKQCGQGDRDATDYGWYTFCSLSCALQFAMGTPIDDPAWNKVSVGTTEVCVPITGAVTGQ